MVCSKKKFRFASMSFIVICWDKMFLASETGRLTVVDAIVKFQGLDQPKLFKSCKDLDGHFCQNVLIIFLNQCQAR